MDLEKEMQEYRDNSDELYLLRTRVRQLESAIRLVIFGDDIDNKLTWEKRRLQEALDAKPRKPVTGHSPTIKDPGGIAGTTRSWLVR